MMMNLLRIFMIKKISQFKLMSKHFNKKVYKSKLKQILIILKQNLLKKLLNKTNIFKLKIEEQIQIEKN